MRDSSKKIAIIIGTKAELIKCMPVMLELQKRKQDYWFIHTGQHPLGDLSRKMGLKKPDFVIRPEPKISTKYWAIIRFKTFIECVGILWDIRRLIKKIRPKYVIYHGDTMSTAMAAGATSTVLNPFKTWKNVHLEAGLESGSLKEPFPEEITRRIISKFTDILFAVSDQAVKNLQNRINFVGGEIIKTGNSVVDATWIAYNNAKKIKREKIEEDYFLLNVHRYENLKDINRLKSIIEILKQTKIKGIWPIHDNTKKYLEKWGLMREVKRIKNIEIVPLLNHEEWISLLINCKYVLADGGSIQEECLVLKKPDLILRKFTERKEGLTTGINFLTGLDLEYSKKIIKDIESNKFKIQNFKNPYGEVGLTKKIVDLLK